MVEVPPVVIARACNEGARDWLDDLENRLHRLASAWNLAVGQTYADATEAVVVNVTLRDGSPAVLKLVVPQSAGAVRHEATVLRLCDGRGCVKLLRHDLDEGALLLERLGPSLSQLSLPIRERHQILCSTVMQVWRPAQDSGLPTGADQARKLSTFIAENWETLNRPCSRDAVDHALECAQRRARAHHEQRAVLVHGDVHQWNALASPDGKGLFKLVDPDGVLAEPEYDLGVIMREDPEELLLGDPRDRASWLARTTGRDATAVWEWGVVDRVANGLLLAKIGLLAVGSHMLAAADRVASLAGP